MLNFGKKTITRIERILYSKFDESMYNIVLDSSFTLIDNIEYKNAVIICKENGLCNNYIKNKFHNIKSVMSTGKKNILAEADRPMQFKLDIYTNKKIQDYELSRKMDNYYPTKLITKFSFLPMPITDKNYESYVRNISQSFSMLLFGDPLNFTSYWWSENAQNNEDEIYYYFYQ